LSRKKKSDPGNIDPLDNIIIVSGGIWKTEPVGSQPRIRLSNCRIMRTERGEIHFIGYAVDDYEGRVSTAIQSLDLAARTGVTSSGRLYELIGKPGCDPDADYTWGMWARVNGVKCAEDVTAELLSGERPCTPSGKD
jgi:hypothetical protein